MNFERDTIDFHSWKLTNLQLRQSSKSRRRMRLSVLCLYLSLTDFVAFHPIWKRASEEMERTREKQKAISFDSLYLLSSWKIEQLTVRIKRETPFPLWSKRKSKFVWCSLSLFERFSWSFLPKGIRDCQRKEESLALPFCTSWFALLLNLLFCDAEEIERQRGRDSITFTSSLLTPLFPLIWRVKRKTTDTWDSSLSPIFPEKPSPSVPSLTAKGTRYPSHQRRGSGTTSKLGSE